MAEVKRVGKTAESGGIQNVAPAVVEPPITITEVKPPGVIHAREHLEQAGDMVVEEFKPSDEDLARLAKSAATARPGQAEPTPETVPERATIIPASTANRTMAEMERGRKIVEERTKLRERMLAGG